MARRLTSIIAALWLTWLATFAQPLCRITKYDEADGVASWHISQLLQDEQGFLWFATWNGLCRYDGYEFQTFKPKAGDGCHMVTDRIRDIGLRPDGNILCREDDNYYLFDLTSYRFRDLTADEQRQAPHLITDYRQSHSLLKGKSAIWTDSHGTQWTLASNGDLLVGGNLLSPTHSDGWTPEKLSFTITDHQRNQWVLDNGCIYKLCTDWQRTQRLPITPPAEVKCLFADRQGRYWVATKQDKALRVYDASTDRLIGYLGADGRLHATYTSFGAAVYCMMQSSDGTMWLGTKPDGIFLLKETTAGVFLTEHVTVGEEPTANDVYHIAEDRYGRLWVATLGGGLFYTEKKDGNRSMKFTMPRQYPKDACPRARYIYFADDVMLVATSNGLLTAPLKKHADDMTFHLHQREPDRAESLSSSAMMDVVRDASGRLFVSTESGGINQIVGSTDSTSFTTHPLTFRHLSDQFHAQSNDIVQSLTPLSGGRMMAIGSHQITLLDSTLTADDGSVAITSTVDDGFAVITIDQTADYRFSEAQPLQLTGNRWLIGLTDGALIISEEQMMRQAYRPPLVLTMVSVQGKNIDWAIERADTLTLAADERSLTIHFAALDYAAPDRISYAFRLQPNEQWNYIGHDRSATLLDLEPGTYQFEVQSTNADGEWQPNTRRLTLIVKPTFWEAWYGQLLIVLLIAAIIAAIGYTYLYIRRIKRQQHETLEKYLALMEKGVKTEYEPMGNHEAPDDTSPPADDDPMLQRIMAYVEQNLGNSDANVGDMAAAAATSRSGLQRKLRQAMGVTPQDLLREARLKHACQLLRLTDKTVAEVAYACGFTDPKYFSRCFKQSVGQSPTEYKNASN